MHLLMMDTVTSEYLFTRDFFDDTNMFDEIFTRTVHVLKSAVDMFCQNTYDMLGLLIILR